LNFKQNFSKFSTEKITFCLFPSADQFSERGLFLIHIDV